MGVELIYPDGVAVASSQFRVGEITFFTKPRLVLVGLIVAVLIVFVAFWLSIGKYKHKSIKRKRSR